MEKSKFISIVISFAVTLTILLYSLFYFFYDGSLEDIYTYDLIFITILAGACGTGVGAILWCPPFRMPHGINIGSLSILIFGLIAWIYSYYGFGNVSFTNFRVSDFLSILTPTLGIVFFIGCIPSFYKAHLPITITYGISFMTMYFILIFGGYWHLTFGQFGTRDLVWITSLGFAAGLLVSASLLVYHQFILHRHIKISINLAVAAVYLFAILLYIWEGPARSVNIWFIQLPTIGNVPLAELPMNTIIFILLICTILSIILAITLKHTILRRELAI